MRRISFLLNFEIPLQDAKSTTTTTINMAIKVATIIATATTNTMSTTITAVTPDISRHNCYCFYCESSCCRLIFTENDPDVRYVCNVM